MSLWRREKRETRNQTTKWSFFFFYIVFSKDGKRNRKQVTTAYSWISMEASVSRCFDLRSVCQERIIGSVDRRIHRSVPRSDYPSVRPSIHPSFCYAGAKTVFLADCPRWDPILNQMINKHVLRASFATPSFHLSDPQNYSTTKKSHLRWTDRRTDQADRPMDNASSKVA